jgi:hypothetical protein
VSEINKIKTPLVNSNLFSILSCLALTFIDFAFTGTDIDHTKEEFEQIGMSVTVHREQASGNHLSITSPHKKQPRILVIAHRDTMFSAGEAEKRPFEIIGDKMYVPGIKLMMKKPAMFKYFMPSKY